MKATDKKNNKPQTELLRVLDQPMVSELNGGKDSKKTHEEFLMKKAKENTTLAAVKLKKIPYSVYQSIVKTKKKMSKMMMKWM